MKRTRLIVKVTRTVISFMICLFVVFSSIPFAHAATNSGAGTVQKSGTTYGTYSWLYSKAGILGIVFDNESNWSALSVDIELKNYYSGNITITISGISNFANVGILVTGGYIAQKSTNQVQVQLVYSNKIHVEFYSTTPFISTSYNWTCSVGVGTLNLIDHSEASSLDDIAAAVTNNTYGLQAIYNDLESIEDALGTLSSINNYLDQSLAVEKMQLYPVWQRNAIFWASSMGTLLFDRNLPYFHWDSANNTGGVVSSQRIKITKNNTTSLVFYTTYDNPINYINVYGSHSSDVVVTGKVSTVVPTSPLYLWQINFKNNYNGTNAISIEFSRDVDIYPLFLGDSDLIPDDIHLLMGTEYDNTYTRLLQQMINAVGTISQTQITENNTNISNYNDYQTTINNVENNYYNQFNNYETSIEQNNAFDFTGLSNDGINQYRNIFSNVYAISLVKWPLMIVLLGLVLVFILG